MGDGTKISWSEATWNVVTGCTRVSSGCDHCYIERTPPFRMAHRKFDGEGIGSTTGVLLHPERFDIPVRWKRPRRIFVCSLADVFHDDVPDGFLVQLWETMAQCPQHIFQILTKRPARMRSFLKRWHDNTGDDQVWMSVSAVSGGDRHQTGLTPMPRGPEAVRATYSSPRARLFADMLDYMGEPPEGAAYPLYDWMDGPCFHSGVLSNVWCGVTAEDQKTADLRIPILLETPAAVRWVSAEPLLGGIDLLGDVETPGPVIARRDVQTQQAGPWGPAEYDYADEVGIDWVVCGGESGPGARPMHPWWAEKLHGQCEQADIAWHFKQWGEWTPMAPYDKEGRFDFSNGVAMTDDGNTYKPGDLDYPDGPRRGEAYRTDFPHHHPTSMYKVGKKVAGRELYHDGRTFDGYPDE